MSGLTDGVPEEIERRLAGMSLATPAKWLAAALQAEDSVQRDASQRLSKQQLVQREPHLCDDGLQDRRAPRAVSADGVHLLVCQISFTGTMSALVVKWCLL